MTMAPIFTYCPHPTKKIPYTPFRWQQRQTEHSVAESATFVLERGHPLPGLPSRPGGPIAGQLSQMQSRRTGLAHKRSAVSLLTLARHGHGRILPLRRTPVSLTPRQDLPRSRPQSRTRFGDFSEEQDYNSDSPPNHVARSRSPSTDSRGGILRTPRASQQNTARTTQRTTASPRRTTRKNTPGRSQTPRRTPREPDHPLPGDDDSFVATTEHSPLYNSVTHPVLLNTACSAVRS